MSDNVPRWTDERVESLIGTLLRVGVTTAAVVVLIGGIWYLVRHGAAVPDYRAFRGEPSQLRSLSGIIVGVFDVYPRGIIQFGLLLLIATPVARVVFAAFAFWLQRDRTYLTISLIVLAVLVYSLAGGHIA